MANSVDKILNYGLRTICAGKEILIMFTAMLCILCSGCSSEEGPIKRIEIAPRLNASDSLAMVNIYQAIGPWMPGWDVKDINTWGGVTAALDKEANEYRIVGFEYYNGNFRGTIPEDFLQLDKLERLGIAGGELSGSIPEWIGDMSNLIYLSLGNNQLSGEIPESMGKLKNLQYLSIKDCRISGEIPASLGNLNKVFRLNITHTNISGEIPASLANMDSLRVLDLTDNKLSGRFTIELLKKRNYSIDCSRNEITELPFEIWKDDFVGDPPMLYENKLSGTIPDWVFETDKWKSTGAFVSRQKEGYGYDNYK